MKEGKKLYNMTQADDSTTIREFYPVKYSKNAEKLLSVTTKLSNRAKLSINGYHNLLLTYEDGPNIVFDRRLKIKNESSMFEAHVNCWKKNLEGDAVS